MERFDHFANNGLHGVLFTPHTTGSWFHDLVKRCDFHFNTNFVLSDSCDNVCRIKSRETEERQLVTPFN